MWYLEYDCQQYVGASSYHAVISLPHDKLALTDHEQARNEALRILKEKKGEVGVYKDGFRSPMLTWRQELTE